MARRPRRRIGRYIKGPIDERLDLGTLAANTLVLAGLSTVTERTLITSIIANWSLRDVTPAAGVGPFLVGVAHSDYSIVEIEEFLEQTTGWAEANKVSQEISRRKIRRVGTIPVHALATEDSTLNEGRPTKTKLNWIINSGQTISVWVYNAGDVAVGTTDPDLVVTGHANLFPK